MLSLCTLCGLCPCPNIRADIIRGKTEHVGRNGLPFANRILADIQSVGKISGWFSDLVNIALSIAPLNRIAKKQSGFILIASCPGFRKKISFHGPKRKDCAISQVVHPESLVSPDVPRSTSFPRLPWQPWRRFSSTVCRSMSHRSNVAACPRCWKEIRPKHSVASASTWTSCWNLPNRVSIRSFPARRAAM